LRNPYEVLGLQPGATRAEARSAFRRLARLHHPDVSDAPDARERFEEARAAYEAITDEPAETLQFRPGRPSREEREREEAERLRQKAQQMMREHRASRPRGLAEAEASLAGLGASNPARAEAAARRVLAQFPSSAVANGLLGDIALMRGRRSEALLHYSVAAQSSPQEARFQQMVELLLRDGGVERREPSRAEAAAPPSGWGIGLAAGAAALPFLLPAPWGQAAGFAAAGLAIGTAERATQRVPSLRSQCAATVVGVNPFALASVLGTASLWLGAATYLLAGTSRGLAGHAGGRMFGLAAAAVAAHTLAFAYRSPGAAVQGLLWASGAAWAGTLAGWSLGSLATLGRWTKNQ
jgi:tetratricopeptide (TPR) repeat protein